MSILLLISISVFLLASDFTDLNKTKPKLPKEYVYIPAGTLHGGYPETDRTVVLSEYYISKYEITNHQYRKFLQAVIPNLSDAEIEKIKVDSTGWNLKTSYGEPMKLHYFAHPAYNQYPVVNISHAGAFKYCSWLQEMIQKDNPKFQIRVMLPTRSQWTYAAKGGRNDAIYPWSGNYLRDKYGKYLCNFNFIDETAVVRNKETGKPELIEALSKDRSGYSTVMVGTYYSNDFALFNMSGNAAEMIDSTGISMGGSWQDYGGEVRVTSSAKYEGPPPIVGFRPILFVTEITKK